MKKVFPVTEAKAQFSKLLRRVGAGEEITITYVRRAGGAVGAGERAKGQAAAWFL